MNANNLVTLESEEEVSLISLNDQSSFNSLSKVCRTERIKFDDQNYLVTAEWSRLPN